MSHYPERLELLQRLAGRLEMAGVPCVLKRHVPASAPSSSEEATVPALLLGGELGWVRVLYWRLLGPDESRPFFVWRDSVRRFSVDAAGIDGLTSAITAARREARVQCGQRVVGCAGRVD